MGDVVSRGEARRRIDAAKAAGKRVVFANGVFDVLHGGHISYIESARDAGDMLVLGLNSDASVREYKGEGRPIVPQDDRAAILAAMEAVDCVVIFDEPTVDPMLEELMPTVHAKGTDYTAETVPERETALRLGIEILIAGAPKQNATRAIIKQAQAPSA
jgi:rfaE bifunctional protein nucleotidyltransferase chain/domain